MPRLPRLTETQRAALMPGPAMDRAVWYSVRRLPRLMHPLHAWPAPRPWSTEDSVAMQLLSWLATHYPSALWDMDVAYRWGSPSGCQWTCTMAPSRGRAWEVEGEGATCAEAICRAMLMEVFEEDEAPAPLVPPCARVDGGRWPVKDTHHGS